MKFEIESMKVNDVWTLVDLLEGVEFIRCKRSSKERGVQMERWRFIKSI